MDNVPKPADNKYNPYIYKSKKMAEIFEPSSVIEGDEKDSFGKDNT